MGALALQGIEVERQHRDQGLALAGLHLGDLSLVEDHAADHLDIEGAQPDGSARRFPDHGKGFGQHVVEQLALLQPLAKLGGLRLQLIVGELFDQRLELVHVGDPLEVPLDLARVGIA